MNRYVFPLVPCDTLVMGPMRGIRTRYCERGYEMMFVQRESTEVIVIDKEVKVVGLSLQKSGLPISFESLGELWNIYGETYRGKIKNAETPIVEYGICLNKEPDYIAGCGVSEIDEVNEICLSYVIPKGTYIKDTFNAETFEQLTGEVIEKRNVKAWAKKNKITVDGLFTIEVYPTEKFESNVFEMYTLTPVKK